MTTPPPHITDLLDLTPAVDAALIGMTTHELKAQGDPDPQATAAALWADAGDVERRDSRAIMLAAVYPAARVIAEQAYARAWADAGKYADGMGAYEAVGQLNDDPGPDAEDPLPVNPFAEGAVDV